jgi:hypothetical protein
MTALDALLILAAYFIGRAVGERRSRRPLSNPYLDQNKWIADQQLSALSSLDTPAMRHIFTGPLSDWQIKMMERDAAGTPEEDK